MKHIFIDDFIENVYLYHSRKNRFNEYDNKIYVKHAVSI